MVIFAAVAMIVVVIAGTQLLLVTHGATHDPSDPTLYGFLATIGLGTPLVWTLLNLALLMARRQTGGQYVAGVRVSGADGEPPSRRALLAWWFCLNPVLFSWPMALVSGLAAAGAASLVLQQATLIVFTALMLLCALAPIVALISAGTDGRRRGLHDRIASTIVVPVE